MVSTFKGGARRIVNIHEAKTHLSRLIKKTARSEAMAIATAGKPLVKVTAPDRSAAG
ncbi:hypothetical protein [Microvirga aerilata]|uniref:type II toxin-antitoxin system Phd/YefM family antitoxin n=1 Tax=Microvirga aerilata TaxID=670292 RepID=UPI0028AE1095|nr:hypothetical protein [Microvirga aerilata]